jgi:hypothetical protein
VALMPVDFSQAIRTEDIQREALLVLFDNLNDKIDELEPMWLNKDSDLYDRMEKVNPGWTVEHIPSDNFLPGTLAPLMSRPIEEYPNVATIAYIARPTNSSDDNGEMYQIRLAIEIMVKSELSEQEVNSRIKKTLEAAHLTLFDNWDNRTLNHLVHELPAPQETTGDVFAIKSRDNQKWFWQGGSLEYLVSKYMSFDE